ncbi:copper resistance protein CopC [Micromonospora sp. WMMD1082]|uniref:copper resistance protein CopC n=1 Tax=Micromonospora sp. WMMD1082 TaxID=3016104 RepID=UPI0024160EA5|nr:copper resistance protein CopC [Micromonospora sp. WMMD1082]MDG4793438.1 copper resistance protein CopC [Micromonospora sp. WMMD1082]
MTADTSSVAQPPPAADGRTWPRRVAAAAVGVVVLAVALLTWWASSQSVELREVTPADGAALAAGPAEVALTFSGEPAVEEMHLVVSRDGVSLPARELLVRNNQVVLPVTVTDLGDYRIAYHVRMADGAEFSGISAFRVGGLAEPAPTPAGSQVAASGHDHDPTDPTSGALLILNLLLITTVVVLMVRGPRRR